MKRRKAAPEKIPAVDLDKIEAALNDSSRHAAAQWLGYLSLLTYLFFTTVAVTHYDLLVETPIKLPLIGVELGLFSFFVWTPALFLVVHLYIVRKAALLAKRATFYQEQLAAQKVAGAQLTARKNRLDAFAVTSLLLQAEEGKAQRSERMLPGFTWAVVYTTLFLLPLALYLAFQIFFLAYQSEAVTTWHRIAVVIGAYLAFVGAQRAGAMRGERKNAFLSRSLAVAVVVSSFLVLTFPGERLYETKIAGVRVQDFFRSLPIVLRPRQSERLFVEAKKTGKLEDANTLDLAGRDFSERNFQGAQLSGVNLRGAKLVAASLQNANLRGAGLQGADLSHASVQGADLRGASMQGADLSDAGLQGADLRGVNLQGAYLSYAGLQGADLSIASLQGAHLLGASLQGADLSGASLQGAFLDQVYLWRTAYKNSYLRDANIEGIFFNTKPYFLSDNVTKKNVSEWLSKIKSENARNNIEKKLTEFGDPFDDIAAWAEKKDELDKVSERTSLEYRADIIAQYLCPLPNNEAAIRSIIIFYGIFDYAVIDRYNDIVNPFYMIKLNKNISIATFQSIISDKQRCPAAVKLTDKDWQILTIAVAAERRWLINFEADQWFERAGLKK